MSVLFAGNDVTTKTPPTTSPAPTGKVFYLFVMYCLIYNDIISINRQDNSLGLFAISLLQGMFLKKGVREELPARQDVIVVANM